MTLRWLGSWQAEYGDDDATKLAPLMSGVFKVNVGRTGVLFSVEVGIDAVANVLDRRRQHPDYATYHDGLRPLSTPGVILPMQAQKEIQKAVFDDWKAANRELVLQCQASSKNNTQANRTLTMLHRRWCFKTFGGREWLYLLIAVGDVNSILMEATQRASEELLEIRKRKLGDKWKDPEEWKPATMQRKEASASSAGQPKWSPVIHYLSDAKALREKARKLDNKIEKEQAAWEAGRSTMSRGEWSRLQWQREEAWQKANEAGGQTDVEYKGRGGEIINKRDQKDTWVGRALAYYEEAIASPAARQRLSTELARC